jgi:hypothetical protein
MDWAESEKRSRIRGKGARMRQVVTKYRRIEAGGCRSWAGQGGRRYHSTSKEEVVLGHGEGRTRKLREAMTLDQEMIRVRGATLRPGSIKRKIRSWGNDNRQRPPGEEVAAVAPAMGKVIAE